MKLSLKAGTTSKLVDIFILDSSKTDGSGLTGLTSGSSGLTAYYYREGANAATSISLTSMTLGTWTSAGFIVIDGTNMPGCYQLGIPDAALASGAKSVVIMLKGATNMAPVLLEIELTATDNQDAVRGGMTALPNANAEAAGGLYTRGGGAGQITQSANGQIDAKVVASSIVNGLRKNVAFTAMPFVLIDSATHQPATGKSPTVTRSIDGGSFGGGTLASVTEIAHGIYTVDGGSGDSNGTFVTFRATAADCDDTLWTVITVP